MFVSEPIKINKNKTNSEITLFLNSILEKMILLGCNSVVHGVWGSGNLSIQNQ